MRKSDVLDFDGVEMVAKYFPNTRATAFLDWFTFSDNSIDGQSRKKAYTLFESGILDGMQAGTIQSLQQIRASDSSVIRELLRCAMTDQINDREIFTKGIDYSYYYEQED